jgi:hypothetical protein
MARSGDGNGLTPQKVMNLCVDLLAHVESKAPGAHSAPDCMLESTVALTEEEQAPNLGATFTTSAHTVAFSFEQRGAAGQERWAIFSTGYYFGEMIAVE